MKKIFLICLIMKLNLLYFSDVRPENYIEKIAVAVFVKYVDFMDAMKNSKVANIISKYFKKQEKIEKILIILKTEDKYLISNFDLDKLKKSNSLNNLFDNEISCDIEIDDDMYEKIINMNLPKLELIDKNAKNNRLILFKIENYYFSFKINQNFNNIQAIVLSKTNFEKVADILFNEAISDL